MQIRNTTSPTQSAVGTGTTPARRGASTKNTPTATSGKDVVSLSSAARDMAMLIPSVPVSISERGELLQQFNADSTATSL